MTTDRELLQEAVKALEEFSCFAQNVETNGDDNYWKSNIHKEQISYWFGPTCFAQASATLERINKHLEKEHE
jgi:hypothetical protein